MANEVISRLEMCMREGTSGLQRGMNFGLRHNHSVILMSLRPNAPYQDRLEDGRTTVIYEGYDQPRNFAPEPKKVDQPERTLRGKLTQNGKFHQAAQEYKRGLRPPERVRIYEKPRDGIWPYNGVFHLVDSWQENDGRKSVFKFKLVAVEGEEDFDRPPASHPDRRRIIPTSVKLAVWQVE